MARTTHLLALLTILIILTLLVGCSSTNNTPQKPLNSAAEAKEPESQPLSQPPACNPDWNCTEWGNCTSGRRFRSCINHCGIIEDMPPIVEECGPVVAQPRDLTSAQEEIKESIIEHFSGNISKLALREEDLPLRNEWSKKLRTRITDENYLTGEYVSPKDKADGWEGGVVAKYYYNDLDLSTPIDEPNMIHLVQVVFAFPIVDGKINSTHTWITGNESQKLSWAKLEAYENYDFITLDYDPIDPYNEDGTLKGPQEYPHEVYPPFGIGQNEFIYSYSTSNYGEYNYHPLYGIVFTKGNIFEKISIYGYNINLDILKAIATKAAEKIDKMD